MNTNKIFNWKDTFYIGLLIVIVCAAIVYIGKTTISSLPLKATIISLAEVISIMGTVFVYLKIKKISLREIGFNITETKWIYMTIPLTILVSIVGNLSYNFIIKYFPSPTDVEVILGKSMFNNPFLDFIHLGILVGILISISEEILFRGILYRYFRQNMNFWYASILSSTIFTGAHFSIPIIISGFFQGMIAAYAYEKTNSITVPIIIHVVVNTFTSITILTLHYLR